MSSASASKADIAELRRQVNEQAEVVKALKKSLGPSKKNDPELLSAVGLLQKLKLSVAEAELGDPEELARLAAAKAAREADAALRGDIETVLRHRGFVFPSNEIHSGPAGFFDFGPVGCALKNNLLQAWRNHFVMYEGMLEIECPAMTPEVVFKTSGHVERFSDWMVTDPVDDVPYRADKLVEEHCERALADPAKPPTAEQKEALEKALRDAGAMDGEQLAGLIAHFDIKSPSGNALSAPFAFNLMFKSQIGPSGKSAAYLRPETAQGMFVNFKRLLELNAGKMPFAAAQIGSAFRNEIAPRQGLLRVREFTLAEIEHFVNPSDKSHVRYSEIADLPLLLLPRDAQEKGEMEPQKIPAREAIATGVINNETLAYFMARTQLFLIECGIRADKLRFRQHKATEMAHYATDCWDAEILTTHGWIECVGHADRAAFDLAVHAKATGVDLTAVETFDQPREVEVPKFDVKNAIIGKTFGKKSKEVTEYIRSLNLADGLKLEEELAKNGTSTIRVCSGDSFELTRAMVFVSSQKELQHTARYTPNVIEPSFGIGRIFYAILEHTYYVRAAKEKAAASAAAAAKGGDDAEDGRRVVFALPSHLAPTKLSILPISNRPELEPISRQLAQAAVKLGVSFKLDASAGSIGRRYARADEIGIPFGITVDLQSPTDQRVTIRERDSMQQIRVAVDAALPIVQQLAQGTISWAEAYEQNDKFSA